MKFFLLTFQFPGGHLKAKDTKELIDCGIRFKPAQMILKVLMAGNTLLANKEMSLNAEEATYCLFNDLRVTTGKQTPHVTAEIILKNRKMKKMMIHILEILTNTFQFLKV